jgi:hypothetical protein
VQHTIAAEEFLMADIRTPELADTHADSISMTPRGFEGMCGQKILMPGRILQPKITPTQP